MKFISPKTKKVYDLEVCIQVKIPPEIYEEVSKPGKNGQFQLQIAETKKLKLYHGDTPWTGNGCPDYECETGGFYEK